MTAYALGMSLLPHARTRVDMATLTCTWTFTFAFACSDGAKYRTLIKLSRMSVFDYAHPDVPAEEPVNPTIEVRRDACSNRAITPP